MKFLARILIACALAASASFAPLQASAQTQVPTQTTFIPRLGASVSVDAVAMGGVVIQYLHPNSPLQRMWSMGGGQYYPKVGDTILSANGIAISDAFQLNQIVARLRGQMAISLRDATTGTIYSGYVMLL